MGGSLALVLSGGGARGAFEVGVLSWVAEHRPALLDQIRVVTGSSVGAVNAAYLASHGLTPRSVADLAAIWRGLSMDRVMLFSSLRVAKALKRKVMGPDEPIGLFDTDAYERLIREGVDWRGLDEVLRSRRLDAFAVAATEITSGGTHVFVQHHDDLGEVTWPGDGTLVGRRVEIDARHVLASTSLPFIFAPVRIDDRWYCDGGLRQNTPLSPALRLGADRLLAISVKSVRSESLTPPGAFPGMSHLLGKLFNSIFLDRMLWDLDRLHRINDVLAAARRAGGDELLPRLRAELVAAGRRPYHVVDYVGVRPEVDLGRVAGDLMAHPERLRSRLRGPMRALLNDRTGVADVASYLLFDGAYAEALIAAGRQAAAVRAAELDRLLVGAVDAA